MLDQLIRPGKKYLLILLMVFQAICAAFFILDLRQDYAGLDRFSWFDVHLLTEVAANLGLLGAIIVEWRVLRRLIQRNADAERALSVASGALHDVLLRYFRDWGLTPSEADVATFTIKGCSIAEVAAIRGSGEGTVKSQLNAIYRKSGLTGRGQLVSLLIEELLQDPPVSTESKGARLRPEATPAS